MDTKTSASPSQEGNHCEKIASVIRDRLLEPAASPSTDQLETGDTSDDCKMISTKVQSVLQVDQKHQAKLFRSIPEYYSRGIQQLGFASVYKAFKSVAEKGLPIVSVGSGKGTAEKDLSDQLLLDNIPHKLYLVDPAPGSMTPSIDKYKSRECQPDYDTVNDLLQAHPMLKGNCSLFLNWPYTCETTYDMEAVHSLMPKYIVAVYASDGASGGRAFLSWLQSFLPAEHPYDYSWTVLRPFPTVAQYVRELSEAVIPHIYPEMPDSIVRLMVLARKDVATQPHVSSTAIKVLNPKPDALNGHQLLREMLKQMMNMNGMKI